MYHGLSLGAGDYDGLSRGRRNLVPTCGTLTPKDIFEQERSILAFDEESRGDAVR